MLKQTTVLALAAAVALSCSACREEYRFRIEVWQSGCAFRDVTAGRESELFPAGSSAEFERHADTFAGTAMTFEVLCGPTPKRYTIAGTSCEEGCRLRSEICDVDALDGETGRFAVGQSNIGFGSDFYYSLRFCEFDNGQRLASDGPGPIPPD